VDRAFAKFGFDKGVRALCEPYYEMDASKGGQPGIDPVVYFKMLMVGFFENIASERAIAARCADSLSVREFLHYSLTEQTPHHSSLSVIRNRLPVEVYGKVFELMLKALKSRKLIRGKNLAIDTSVIEANASLRSLKNRFTEEEYGEYIKRLAAQAGVDTSETKEVKRFDRKRRGRKTSNDEWENPHDADAKVGPHKKGATRMIYKPEHVVDLETGAIVDAELNFGDWHDAAALAGRLLDVEERLNEALDLDPDTATIETVYADCGYHNLDELAELQRNGIRTAIPDPVRNRNLAKLDENKRRTLQNAGRTLRGTKKRALMRRRGELLERSFEHTLDEGGGRRTTLRGWVNVKKRHLIQAATTNLSLLMRTLCGIGTVKQAWAASL
jgi:transposase